MPVVFHSKLIFCLCFYFYIWSIYVDRNIVSINIIFMFTQWLDFMRRLVSGCTNAISKLLL